MCVYVQHTLGPTNPKHQDGAKNHWNQVRFIALIETAQMSIPEHVWEFSFLYTFRRVRVIRDTRPAPKTKIKLPKTYRYAPSVALASFIFFLTLTPGVNYLSAGGTILLLVITRNYS